MKYFRNLFPDNMVQMTFQQYRTKLVPSISIVNYTVNDTSVNQTNITYNPEGTNGGGINVLGLVMFCLIFGGVIGKMGEQGKILVQFFEALNEASIKMINLVMM
jgi:solute carrier family 1 (high affinity glutamate transporter) protein 1